MPLMAFALLGLLVAFLLGSIPTGYLLVKAKTGKDIRTLGSGNIGSTNVGRVLGGKWGYLVLFLDVFKGLAATLVGFTVAILSESLLLYIPEGGEYTPPQTWAYLRLLPLYCPFAAIAGHCFSPWLGWRGGKGVATMFGSTVLPMAMVAFPVGALAASFPVNVYLIFSKVMRLVSLGSIGAALALPVGVLSVVRWDPVSLVVTLPITLLILWRHKENIKRLLAGTERRMGEPEGMDEG